MDFILNRYRNLTALVVAILAQLLLLAYQVKSNGEVRLIRVWAISAVTPLARLLEGGRSGASHFFSDYFVLLDVREENKRLRADLDRVNMENQYLRTELSTADRASSLAIFQQHSPLKTVAAHIIGNTTGTGGQVVIIDRGTPSGVQNGMAVITPDGIVGKVISVYPTASMVRLVTDQTFAAGVISQKHRVHGTLRGQGHSTVTIDHIQNEQTVETGEWFYTSGDDRIFPKGLPVGQASVVRPGKTAQEIFLTPSGFQNGLEEVLIIVQGVHMEIPDQPAPGATVHLEAPPPADSTGVDVPVQSSPLATEADRVLDRYRKLGEAQKHSYGDSRSGPPNFNAPLRAPAAAPAAGQP